MYTYAKTAEQKLPSMKKQSTVDTDGEGAVGMDRQYRSTTDLSKELAPEDRVKTFKYGKEQVSPLPVRHHMSVCRLIVFCLFVII